MQARSETQDLSRAWKVLAVTSVATFAAALDTTIVFMAFPDIQRSFDTVTRAELSWVINAYTIIFAALLVPAGRLADRIGRRRVFFAGVALFAFASALCGAAPSAPLLISARALQAVGAALLFPASLSLVLGEFPQSRRASAVAIWGAIGALAAALGPSLGGLIIDGLGWRWAFYLNLPVAAAALFMGRRLLRESFGDRDERPDLAGVPLMIAGVGLLALGIVQSDEWGWGDTRTLASFAASAVVLGGFLLRSARHPSPALDLKLFRDHNYRMANLATLSFGVAFAGMFMGTVLFLTMVWQYSILTAGLYIWPGPLTAAFVAAPAGRLADRIGHRRPLVLGGLVFAAGSAWLIARAQVEPDVLGVWLPALIITGVGVGLTMPILSSAAVHSLPQARFAVGSAVNQTVRQVGAVLGVALVIALLGTPGPAQALEAFDRIWLLLVAGGVLTALIGLTIDTRLRPVTEVTPRV